MIQITNLTKKFDQKIVFENFSISFLDNKITCILGKSGCGKTTLLNIISKLLPIDGGDIKGNDGTKSYIFQNTRLLENLTVYKNLEYILKNTVIPKDEWKNKIEEMIKRVELYGYSQYFPKQLSGGMAQRVSLARAFIYPSELLLMDEPFKGMDVSTKKTIINLFKELYKEYKKTTVFVTHDIEEALFLGDRIIILDDGGKILFDKEISDSIFDRDIKKLADLRAEIYAII